MYLSIISNASFITASGTEDGKVVDGLSGG